MPSPDEPWIYFVSESSKMLRCKEVGVKQKERKIFDNKIYGRNGCGVFTGKFIYICLYENIYLAASPTKMWDSSKNERWEISL